MFWKDYRCPPPALCSARSYAEFRDLVNARRVELLMTHLSVDIEAGLQGGYFGKLMCGSRNFGPQTLGPILDALGVDIVLVPRQAGTETKTHENALHFAHIIRLRNNSQLGGRLRRAKMTGAEWSKHCRAAANARWQKARKKAKLAACFKRRTVAEAVV
jgi:hypothetical protein